MLFVESYNAKIPENSIAINTTSRSTNWSKGLSPFFVNGGYLYDIYYAKNVENAWQGSKVYPQYVDENGDPTVEYFKWAAKLWNDTRAHRYPAGKGAIPLYSY